MYVECVRILLCLFMTKFYVISEVFLIFSSLKCGNYTCFIFLKQQHTCEKSVCFFFYNENLCIWHFIKLLLFENVIFKDKLRNCSNNLVK